MDRNNWDIIKVVCPLALCAGGVLFYKKFLHTPHPFSVPIKQRSHLLRGKNSCRNNLIS